MWFLYRKVLLTKDNQPKIYWNVSKKCCFSDKDESIEHLFVSCPFTKLGWRMVYMTYNITPPTRITNLFGNWLRGVDKVTKI